MYDTPSMPIMYDKPKNVTLVPVPVPVPVPANPTYEGERHTQGVEPVHVEDTEIYIPFIGCQLRFNIYRWKDLTSDKQILQYVTGYLLEYIYIYGTPSQLLPPFQSCLGVLESEAVNHEIAILLDIGVVIECEHQIKKIISTIFTRPKRDSE